MRLPRTSLLARLNAADAPAFVVMEAPTGFGKSWLLRQVAPPGALRLRGELGPLTDPSFDPTRAVVIDDAHLLGSEDFEQLVEHIEDTPSNTRLMVSGRILPDALRDVGHLVDGLILDASALAVGVDEIVDAAPSLSEALAGQLSDAADGSVRVICAALEQHQLEPGGDLVAAAVRSLRAAAGASLVHLDTNDVGLVGLLARIPGIDQRLLTKLGGAGFVDRALAAGVPLRRQMTGAIDLVAQAAFRTTEIDSTVAARLATALVERDRPIEAVGLLLDAGAHDRAAKVLATLPESVALTVEPRAMLGLLARLGSITESDPALLLARAASSYEVGRLESAGADIERATALVGAADPALRRKVLVEAAEWLLNQGHRPEAVASAEQALRELGPGEDRTYARAHVVLAHGASTSNDRRSLQQAAEWYRVAAAAWETCGESARSRRCRCELATGVLVPLGRYDEALSQMAQILAVPELTDAERAWMVLNEGFVLCNANRLDAADMRFDRAADLGYVQDNPRVIAAAAWGRALVCSRRDDLHGTLRWVAITENTAFGVDDDVLGVPFLCDVTTALGALGELDLAERHLVRAKERSAVYGDEVAFAEFILEARCGRLGDLAAQLAATPPSELWRVQLVAAFAAAKGGDMALASSALADAERELVALGFSDFAGLGERRTYEALQAALGRSAEPQPAPAGRVAAADAVTPAPGRRLRVIGGPMAIEDDGQLMDLPPGNPQRLVGAVVAHGGSASFDQLSEALWPGDDSDASRSRLRNVLLRLRKGAGDVVVRSGSGVRLASGVLSDLDEFTRLADDALSTARSDPDVAGQLAAKALRLTDGSVFGDFEYEEWAIATRRAVEVKLIGLLDLLSVQAEDSGDLALAQSLAERALRLDRYTDSRYVRLAELLTMQGRSAAAVAVLEDASGAARELGGSVPPTVKSRRDELIRRAGSA